MSVRDEYRELSKSLETMDDMIKILSDMTYDGLETSYRLPKSVHPVFSKISMKELEEKTDEQLKLFMMNAVDNSTYEKFLTKITGGEEGKSISEDEFGETLRNAVLDIKKSIDSLDESIKERDSMQKQANDAMEDYIKYINSPEYKKRKMEKLQEMKEQAEKEENLYKKKDMLKKIEAIESSWSLSFLFERFHELGEKEVESIKNAFFDPRKSNYILQKFENKLKSSGYKKDSYKFLFNIEELFLPEEYHVFNNLYLFVVARFVAYANISSEIDRMYIQAIFINSINLVYHNFQSGEDENKMIDIVKQIDDHFTPYTDYFREYNSTCPTHPKRIAMDKEYNEKKRALLMQKLTEENVQFDSSLSTDDLKKLYEEEVVHKAEKESEVENSKEVMNELKVDNLPYNKTNEPSEDQSIDSEDLCLIDDETGEEFSLDSNDDVDVLEEESIIEDNEE